MVPMAAPRDETGTQELRPERERWLLTVVLDGGTELVADVGDDLKKARQQLVAVQSGGDGFVSVGDDTAVRARDVAHARLVEAGAQRADDDRSLAGEDMTMYDTGARLRRGGGGNDDDGRSVLADPRIGYGRRPWSETKPFFLTSEFVTFVVSALAVLIAMAASDILDARAGWLLVTILAAAYMLSRGIAKAGTGDPNPMGRH
jgi:hypothetical protein